MDHQSAFEALLLEYACPVEPEGKLRLFGLEYGIPAAMLSGSANEPFAVLVDPEDVGRVLVRDPRQGVLLVAHCRRPAYASGLSLAAHLGCEATAGCGTPSAPRNRMTGVRPTRGTASRAGIAEAVGGADLANLKDVPKAQDPSAGTRRHRPCVR